MLLMMTAMRSGRILTIVENHRLGDSCYVALSEAVAGIDPKRSFIDLHHHCIRFVSLLS